LDLWASHLADQAIEGLARGWRASITGTIIREVRAILSEMRPRHGRVLNRVGVFAEAHQRLAQRDLAHRPYRWGILGLEKGERVPFAARQRGLPLDDLLREGLNELARSVPDWRGRTRKEIPIGSFDAGLVFATRPPSMMELYRVLASREPNNYGIADANVVERVMNAVRGRFGHPRTYLERRRGLPDVVHVPTDRRKSPVKVALVMMETVEQNTINSANGIPPSKGKRFNSIRALLESVRQGLDDPSAFDPHDPFASKPDYVLLPELSMPKEWFDEFALALMRSGISLIAGIEHQPRPNKGVSNQVWAALKTNNLRSDYFLYRQDKQSPALPEQPILTKTGRTWSPDFRWDSPPVIEHGDFRFGLLICSEFTNINHRAHLRGNVDALFVPEWNQDLHWFESLVEASALDLHAYIAQANTRGYGDTRLRAPAKGDWDRDVVRLKGGRHDYFVVGDIDYSMLRAFHNTPPVPPQKPAKFKPLPDGFRVDPDRDF
jgi:predicted amidohydrolase